MISFISGPHLKEEPCCKFMLKHDMKSLTMFDLNS